MNKLSSYFGIVIAFVGHHGASRLQPRTLAELKTYVRELHVIHPIPAWVFEILDMLEEVRDSLVVSVLKVGTCAFFLLSLTYT